MNSTKRSMKNGQKWGTSYKNQDVQRIEITKLSKNVNIDAD